MLQSPHTLTGSESRPSTPTELAERAGVVELTAQLLSTSPKALADYPPGMRIIVRRERPHPGAQLDLFETSTGWHYTAFATTSRIGQLAALDARHRAHARVEDRIRCAKDRGMRRLPSRDYKINQAWLTAVMIAVDLITWAQTLILHDQPDLAKGEPKTQRYRLLPTAASITRGQRKVRPATHRPHLALGHRARPRIPASRRAPTTRDLTPLPPNPRTHRQLPRRG